MILHSEQLQALECSICHEVLELTRRTAGAPEVLQLVKEEFAQEHRPCEEYPDNPELREAAKKYCRGMRKALENAPRKGLIGRPSSMAHRRRGR